MIWERISEWWAFNAGSVGMKVVAKVVVVFVIFCIKAFLTRNDEKDDDE